MCRKKRKRYKRMWRYCNKKCVEKKGNDIKECEDIVIRNV